MNFLPVNIAVVSAFVSTVFTEDNVLQSHLILSGKTGSGKSSVVKKVGDILKKKGIPFGGFYTKGFSIGTSRCGFDVVDLNTNRSAPMARIAYMTKSNGPRIGKYVVNIQAFEDIVKLTFSDFETLPSILLIDEIGKMELESVFFRGILTDLFKMGSQYIIVVTVPEKRDETSLPGNICNLPTSRIITVSPDNRDILPEMLANEIIQMDKMMTGSKKSTPTTLT